MARRRTGDVFGPRRRAYWLAILLFAILPAFCEEMAFRGFILSGLRHLGHRWRAIFISALFFGITHQVLQQSIITASVGLIIGYIAVQTGSLWPCIAFHATHNSLMLAHVDLREQFPILERLVEEGDPSGMTLYRPVVIVIAAMLAVAVLAYFVRLRPARSAEEALQESIDRSDSGGPIELQPPHDDVSESNGAASVTTNGQSRGCSYKNVDRSWQSSASGSPFGG